jgi:hypothetical protein
MRVGTAGLAAALVGVAAAGAASAAVVSRVTSKSPALNSSESNLTDAQRNALYQANTGQFNANLKSWYAHLDTKTLDLHHLRRAGMMATFAPPEASTFQDAVARAAVALTGSVTEIRSTPGYVGGLPDSFVTVRVDTLIKGSAPSTIVIHQLGGIVPSLDWTGAAIEDADPAPILLPGDHAFLLLRSDPFVAGDFVLEFYTGEYPIDGAGMVSVVPGNPFGSQLSGMSMAAVESLAAASAGTG